MVRRSKYCTVVVTGKRLHLQRLKIDFQSSQALIPYWVWRQDSTLYFRDEQYSNLKTAANVFDIVRLRVHARATWHVYHDMKGVRNGKTEQIMPVNVTGKRLN